MSKAILTKTELAEIERRRRLAHKRGLRLLETADPDEDSAILKAAELDSDALPMTDQELGRMRPAHEVHPELVAKYIRRRGRPKLESSKQQVTLRLDADVLDHFRGRGRGWQTAINGVLRKIVQSEQAASKRSRSR